MTVAPLGDSAVVISLGAANDAATVARVRAVAAMIGRHPPAGVVDIVPAFASVALFFHGPPPGTFESLAAELAAIVARAEDSVGSLDGRVVEVPVCYGGEHGPDLDAVAAHTGRSAAEVVALHSGADYLVHAIGFTPGFPYLGGLPPALATPRRSSPRPRVPAGAVGIGGAQTGIYPLETPGGWNLIGRTPLPLFDPGWPEPARLRLGDTVKFRPIPASEFAACSTQCHVIRDIGRGETIGKAEATCHVLRDIGPGVEVVRAGMFTTVQDLGRVGQRAGGVPLSGAADALALRLANLLVGNPEQAAGLEFTLLGPELRFRQPALVALTGASFGGVPRGRPFEVAAGAVLKLGPAQAGCRGYLAIAGGIDVAPVLGSRSTYGRAGLGGWKGRALRDGDALPVVDVRRVLRPHWRIDERILPQYAREPVVRVVAGAEAGEFDAGWTERSYRVSAHSDRMGVRLNGAPLARTRTADLISSPIAPGAIQVPPDGQPIVLLADAQTVGGYPVIAHVATVDLPLVAQLRPDDNVRFRAVTLAEAREVFAARERALALLHEGLAQKLA